MALRQLTSGRFGKIPSIAVRAMSHGDGVGRGGGGGGSIRDAGGIFGKMEAAREGEYFYKKEKELLKYMKEHLEEEIEHHKELLAKHEAALAEVNKKSQDADEEKKTGYGGL